MANENCCSKIIEAIDAIDFSGEYVKLDNNGHGHINDTFTVFFKNKNGTMTRYVLQRINHLVFTNPDQLMENICSVTSFLREKIAQNKGDINRETLNPIFTKEGKAYFKDSIGSYWRAYQYIDDAACYDQVEKPEDFYQSAYAFGHFQYLLSDYNADSLYETIPNFHNTPMRFQAFKEAVEKDICSRVKNVRNEIRFVTDREKDMAAGTKLQKSGELPLRVTHNDTKLNNIMIDNKTGKGICVIDLDTVMPGLSINDFGDAIRFGANTAKEDETDLSKVHLSLELFEQYTKGYLAGCNGSLTDKELDMLPMGAKLMSLECGMRFLTDYLKGDTYFKIQYEEHNRDRCRTQLKLVEDIEKKMDEMQRIVNRYR